MGQKIQLSESQLRNLIKESVRKVVNESVNELSPEFLKAAKDKFIAKYDALDKDGKLKHDKWNQQGGLHTAIHPKDGRNISKHITNFNNAIVGAEYDDERTNSDSTKKQAIEIFNKVYDKYENEIYSSGDEYINDAYMYELSNLDECPGWEFYWDVEWWDQGGSGDNIYPGSFVYYTAPNGEKGRFRGFKMSVSDPLDSKYDEKAGRYYDKYDRERMRTAKLNESQLRSLIKESVMKAMNEISSDGQTGSVPRP